MEEESVRIDHDIFIDPLDKSHEYFLNKSTILYGASGSGKSTIMLEMLKLLQPYIPNGFVFAPTSDVNDTFTGTIHDKAIFKTVDIKKLERLWTHQEGATKLYKSVNDLKVLRHLFIRLAGPRIRHQADIVTNRAETLLAKNEEDPSINFSEKKQNRMDIVAYRDKFLNRLYKMVIRSGKKRLLKMDLTDLEKYTIAYLDFNPNMLIVMDDCGAQLKAFQKSEIMKNILFMGRHFNITLILVLQDDKGLDSEIKKNAFVSIFTTDQVARAYFTRQANNFGKALQKRVLLMIEYLFHESRKNEHKKLIYIRKSSTPFRYLVADIYDTFRFGCIAFWQLCEAASRKSKELSFEDDPVLCKFKLKF